MKKHIILICFLISGFFLQAQAKLIPYRKNNKWGYSDSTKRIVIPTSYAMAFPFVNNQAIVETEEGDLITIDRTGAVISKLPYSINGVYEASCGLIPVLSKNNKKTALLSISGKMILQAKYDEIIVLGKDSFKVIVANKTGIINGSGKLLKPFKKYNSEEIVEMPIIIQDDLCPKPCICKPYSENMAVVAHKALFGYANESHKIVIPCKYSLADSFLEGLALVTFTTTKKSPKSNQNKDSTIANIGFRKPNGEFIYAEEQTVETQQTKIGFIDKQGNEYWED